MIPIFEVRISNFVYFHNSDCSDYFGYFQNCFDFVIEKLSLDNLLKNPHMKKEFVIVGTKKVKL